MATVQRDSEVDLDARGDEGSRSSAASPGSGSGNTERNFLFGWFSSDKNEAEMEPKQSEKYVVADPKTGAGHSGPMHYLWDLIRDKNRWKDSCQISDPMKEEVQNNETWQARLSLFILKVLWYVSGPLKSSGQWMEYMFNVFISNDGFFKTLYRVLFKKSEYQHFRHHPRRSLLCRIYLDKIFLDRSGSQF